MLHASYSSSELASELIKTSSSDETKLVSEMLWNNCEDEAEKRRKERETERERKEP
jgi:hypothetical protein